RAGIVPPDAVGGQRIADDELVLGGAAGEGTCLDLQRAICREARATLTDGRRNQCCRISVVAQRCCSICDDCSEAVVIEGRHDLSPLRCPTGAAMAGKILASSGAQPSRKGS